MKEYNINELHSCILSMLKEVDRICRENNITYFLSGGSAIGAVRDKGFIQWDDDADIMLPRKDYMKFLKVMKNYKGKYKVGSIYTRKDWTFPFARIWDKTTKVVYENLNEATTGIFIDIYPIDGLPDSLTRTKLHYYITKFRYVCLNAAIRKRFKEGEKFTFLKRVLAFFAKSYGANNICKSLNASASKTKFESSNYVGCSVLCHYMEKERFSKEAFSHQVYVDFEDTKLPVMNGYDEYLSTLYGDYMKPPATGKERESEHHMRYYGNDLA